MSPSVWRSARWRAAAEAAVKGATPLRHNAFKIELAKRAIVRALENALSTGGKQS